MSQGAWRRLAKMSRDIFSIFLRHVFVLLTVFSYYFSENNNLRVHTGARGVREPRRPGVVIMPQNVTWWN
jgi:hypothetical protein